MVDITMSVDDTLEIDAIIQNWDAKSDNTINVTEGTDYNLSGFQTRTGVFNPQSSGNYTITVNSQTLSIKVNDSTNVPSNSVDTFEDGNIDEYNTYSIVSASAQTNTVYEGTYSLKVSAQNNTDSAIVSTSGLNYPNAGEKVDVWTKFGQADVTSVGYGMQSQTSTPNGYYNTLNIRDNEMILAIDNNLGNNSKPVSLDRTTWYRMRFIWKTNGELTFELYDQPAKDNPNPLETINENDTSYTSGGISFKPSKITSDGQSTFYDKMIKGTI